MEGPERTAQRVRARRPVVHCLTNEVTSGRVADVLAALGALPVMASAPEEAAEMVAHAQALVLNLGTPRAERWAAAEAAGRRAHELGIPIVLDPVGCGATPWRTREARALVHTVRPDVIRGNAPEIGALAELPTPRSRLRGITAEADGADDSVEDATLLARRAAETLGAVVVVTGRVDAASDGRRVVTEVTDVPLLRDVVGAGDVSAALIGACLAVEPDPLDAGLAGLQLFKAAAHEAVLAAENGPGSFWTRCLDTIWRFSNGRCAETPLSRGSRKMSGWSPERLRDTLRLYLLADTGLAPPERLPELVAASIRGGVTAVQMRAKNETTLQQLELARALAAVCGRAGIPLIVNDRVDVALAAEAAGAHVGHLGEEDLSPRDARRLLGEDAIIGVSVASAQEARVAAAQGASYVSAGPMFPTSTKANAGPAAGEPLLRSVRAATRLPLVVIGGITAERAASLYRAGADGVCVGAAILRSPDPEQASRAFVEAAGEVRAGVAASGAADSRPRGDPGSGRAPLGSERSGGENA